ncbi:MAG: hypothetical protein L0154_13890 [Chloroflexi bacterium]|nr:hypothetical protein [Chloroflexota bacterium]
MTREFRLDPAMQRYMIAGTVVVIVLLVLAYFVETEFLIIPAMIGAALLVIFYIEDAVFALTGTPDGFMLLWMVFITPALMLVGSFIPLLEIPMFVLVMLILFTGMRMKIAPRYIEVSLTHLRLPSRYREWRWEQFTDIRRNDSRLALYVGNELVFNLPRVADREALYEIIVDQVQIPLMHRKLASLRKGAVINFPNIKLTNELIVIGKDAIPTRDIQNAVLDHWRHLSIYSHENGIHHVDVRHYVLAEKIIKEKRSSNLGNRRDVIVTRSPLTALLCRAGITWKPPKKHIEVYEDGLIVSSPKSVNRWRWEDFSDIQTSNNRTRLLIDNEVVAEIPALLKTD